MLLIWLGLLFVWNELVFVIYAFDKRKAIKKKRRISERNLLVITVLFGGFGALLAAKSTTIKPESGTLSSLGILVFC